MEYLRPQQIAEKLGSSVNFARKVIRNSKCPEKKENGKTLFEFEHIVKYIQLVGK